MFRDVDTQLTNGCMLVHLGTTGNHSSCGCVQGLECAQPCLDCTTEGMWQGLPKRDGVAMSKTLNVVQLLVPKRLCLRARIRSRIGVSASQSSGSGHE